MVNTYFRLILMFLIGCHGLAIAQSKTVLSTDSAALQYAVKFFNAEIKDQSRLYNGRAYNFLPGYEGEAYFLSRTFDKSGTVIFDGVIYDNIPLTFDVFRQKLITVLPDQVTLISLANEKIERFKVYDHSFIHSQIAVANNDNQLESGFFDQLYNGKSKILVKRIKTAYVVSATAKNQLVDKDRYFVEREGKFYRFSSARNLISFFEHRKKEIQKKLREQNILFRENPEQIMVLIATYNDSLN